VRGGTPHKRQIVPINSKQYPEETNRKDQTRASPPARGKMGSLAEAIITSKNSFHNGFEKWSGRKVNTLKIPK